MHCRIVLIAACCGLLSPLTPVRAQAASMAGVPPCTYAECAVRFEPGSWGMRLVRGTAGRHVGWIRPFNTSAVDTLLAGPDSASANARRYVSERRKADFFGLVGAAALGFLLVRNHDGHDMQGIDWAALGVGVISFVPAGRHGSNAAASLSRSVWWYNATLAR